MERVLQSSLQFHHCNTQAKTIYFSNIFLSSYSLNIFLKMIPSTTIIIRGYVYDITVLISGVYSVINLLRLSEHQMTKDRPIPFLAIKKLLV